MDAAKLKENVQEMGRTVQAQVSENFERVKDTVQQNLRGGTDQTRNVLGTLNEDFGSFVRESPVLALGGAFAVGYLVAKIARSFR
jgi:ElaB/YqjD/DUF883 family membrane-anchored ribosome-binding protein